MNDPQFVKRSTNPTGELLTKPVKKVICPKSSLGVATYQLKEVVERTLIELEEK